MVTLQIKQNNGNITETQTNKKHRYSFYAIKKALFIYIEHKK